MSKDQSVNYDNYFETFAALSWEESLVASETAHIGNHFKYAARHEAVNAELLQSWITNPDIEPLHKAVLVETFIGNVAPQYDSETEARPDKITTAKQALAIFDDIDSRLVAGEPYLFDMAAYGAKPKGNLVGVLSGNELQAVAPEIVADFANSYIKTTPLTLAFSGVFASLKWGNAGIKRLRIDDRAQLTQELQSGTAGDSYYDLDMISHNFIDLEAGLCVGDDEILSYAGWDSNDGQRLPIKIAANLISSPAVERVANQPLSEYIKHEVLGNVADDIMRELGDFVTASRRKSSLLDLYPLHLRALLDSIGASNESIEKAVEEKLYSIEDDKNTTVSKLIGVRAVRRGLASLLGDIA